MEPIIEITRKAGMIKYWLHSDRAGGRGTLEYISQSPLGPGWQVEMIQVSPMRSGYGTKILQLMIEELKSLGVDHVTTHPVTEASESFFKKNRFERTSTCLWKLDLV